MNKPQRVLEKHGHRAKFNLKEARELLGEKERQSRAICKGEWSLCDLLKRLQFCGGGTVNGNGKLTVFKRTVGTFSY